MDITIGKSPDFRMMRDQEILSYAASVEINKSALKTNRRFLSHFSLGMLCKNIKEIAKSNQPKNPLFEITVSAATVRVLLSSQADASYFVASFQFSPDLNTKQSEVIVDFISKYFRFTN